MEISMIRTSQQQTDDAVRTGYFTCEDGVRLYYEDIGKGAPIIFAHEFAGDMRIWAPQVSYFSRDFRVVTFNARGYPPSDVPTDPSLYSLDIAVRDIATLIKHLDLGNAHVVGFSMGSFAALFLGLRYPDLARSVTPVCCGYGAEKAWDAIHKSNFLELAGLLENDETADQASDRYANGATRLQYKQKDPKGWAEFALQFRQLSRKGRAMTLRHVLATRPSIYEFADDFKNMEVPVLLITGDEDEQTLQPGFFLKKHIPNLGLCVLPRCGHTVHLEEQGLFNSILYDFISSIEMNTWKPRAPGSFATAHYLEPDQA